MESPLALITEQVRVRVRRDGVDLAAESGLAARYVREEVRRYSERALGGATPLLADEGLVAQQVLAALTGFGVLQPYLDDPGVEELWINGPDRAFASPTPRVGRFSLCQIAPRGRRAGCARKHIHPEDGSGWRALSAGACKHDRD